MTYRLSKFMIGQMPSRHTVRLYVENGVYHVYNRGVEKRIIFQDAQDYQVFLHYMKRYLMEPPTDEVGPRWRLNLHKEIQLFAYCLMPNHFHFLIKQVTKSALTTFMRCFINSYTKYFNKRYERVGSLFQGKFKAAFVETEQYLLHLSRYIHLNPIHHEEVTRSDLVTLQNYPYSSYADFLGKRQTKWVKPDEILSYFKSSARLYLKDISSYQSFVENYAVPPKDFLGELTIE